MIRYRLQILEVISLGILAGIVPRRKLIGRKISCEKARDVYFSGLWHLLDKEDRYAAPETRVEPVVA